MIGAALLACPASYVASFPESDPTARPHEQEKHGPLELTGIAGGPEGLRAGRTPGSTGTSVSVFIGRLIPGVCNLISLPRRR